MRIEAPNPATDHPVSKPEPTLVLERPPSRLLWIDFAVLMAMLIWGSHYAIAKSAVETLPPAMFNLVRFGIGAVVVRAYLALAHTPVAIPHNRWLAIVWAAVLSYIVYQMLFLNGLKNTVVAHSVLITTTAPIGVVIVNILTRRERGSRRIYTGMALAVGGVLIVILARYADDLALGGNTLTGDLLMVGSAITWVAATLSMRRPLTGTPAIVLSFWMLVLGGIFSAVMALPSLLTFDWSSLSPGTLVALLYSGVVAVALAGTIWTIGLQKLGTSRTAIFVNIQPIVAALVATLFLGEPFTLWLVIGTAAVLIGMWRIRVG